MQLKWHVGVGYYEAEGEHGGYIVSKVRDSYWQGYLKIADCPHLATIQGTISFSRIETQKLIEEYDRERSLSTSG